MTTAQVSAVVGVLIVGAAAYVALMTWLGRPEPPVTDPVEQARRDLAERTDEEYARREYEREKADDLNDDARGDDE